MCIRDRGRGLRSGAAGDRRRRVATPVVLVPPAVVLVPPVPEPLVPEPPPQPLRAKAKAKAKASGRTPPVHATVRIERENKGEG